MEQRACLMLSLQGHSSTRAVNTKNTVQLPHQCPPPWECPICLLVTFLSQQNWCELWGLCFLSQICGVPNGFCGCTNPLASTRVAACWSPDGTGGLSWQVELWAGTSHMGCTGWLCALSASCSCRIYNCACCSSCWLLCRMEEEVKHNLQH